MEDFASRQRKFYRAVAPLGTLGKSIPHELLHVRHNRRPGSIDVASLPERVVRRRCIANLLAPLIAVQSAGEMHRRKAFPVSHHPRREQRLGRGHG